MIDITDLSLRTIGIRGDATIANCYNIALHSAGGTSMLRHQIDSYDGTNEQIVAWVKVPTLEYDDDTDLYMYYGSGSVETDQLPIVRILF